MTLRNQENERCFKCTLKFNPWSRPPHLSPFKFIQNKGEWIALVVYPLCQECWDNIEPFERWDYYLALVDRWDWEGLTTVYKTSEDVFVYVMSEIPGASQKLPEMPKSAIVADHASQD